MSASHSRTTLTLLASLCAVACPAGDCDGAKVPAAVVSTGATLFSIDFSRYAEGPLSAPWAVEVTGASTAMVEKIAANRRLHLNDSEAGPVSFASIGIDSDTLQDPIESAAYLRIPDADTSFTFDFAVGQGETIAVRHSGGRLFLGQSDVSCGVLEPGEWHELRFTATPALLEMALRVDGAERCVAPLPYTTLAPLPHTTFGPFGVTIRAEGRTEAELLLDGLVVQYGDGFEIFNEQFEGTALGGVPPGWIPNLIGDATAVVAEGELPAFEGGTKPKYLQLTAGPETTGDGTTVLYNFGPVYQDFTVSFDATLPAADGTFVFGLYGLAGLGTRLDPLVTVDFGTSVGWHKCALTGGTAHRVAITMDHPDPAKAVGFESANISIDGNSCVDVRVPLAFNAEAASVFGFSRGSRWGEAGELIVDNLVGAVTAPPRITEAPVYEATTTWTDALTGLTWQRVPHPVFNPYTFDSTPIYSAMFYCEDIRIDQRTDWRLPTQSELRGLLLACPTVGGCMMSEGPNGGAWTIGALAESCDSEGKCGGLYFADPFCAWTSDPGFPCDRWQSNCVDTRDGSDAIVMYDLNDAERRYGDKPTQLLYPFYVRCVHGP